MVHGKLQVLREAESASLLVFDKTASEIERLTIIFVYRALLELRVDLISLVDRL